MSRGNAKESAEKSGEAHRVVRCGPSKVFSRVYAYKLEDEHARELTVHMCDKHLRQARDAEAIVPVKRLLSKLTNCAFRTVDHCW